MDEKSDLNFTTTDRKSTPLLSIKAIYCNTEIPRLTEDQLYYILLELNGTQSDQVKYIPLNLTLVLDCSTSMQGIKLEMVKTNTIWLLRQLREEDTLSIITFSDQAEILASQIHKQDLQWVESRISLIHPGGSTEIYNGLECGLSELQKNMHPNYLSHLILLTDGYTYGDESACLDLAKKVAKQGIVISCFGYGNKWNDSFLDKLASLSGGESIFISSPKDLHRFLEEKLNRLNRIIINSLSFDYTTGSNVELRYVFRLSPEPGVIPLENPLRLGSLSPHLSVNILLEFSIKENITEEIKEVSLIRGDLWMVTPSQAKLTEKVNIELNCPIGDDHNNESPDSTIMNAMSFLSLYRMQEKARQEIVNGETMKASRHLQYLATHLISKGNKDLARTALEEAERIQRYKNISNEGAKQIKYGTRSLILTSGLEKEEL